MTLIYATQASEWAEIPPKKLLDESFWEQLNYIQTLELLAPLHCTCKYLPQDIITILECLGKVSSTPFDKLYRLAEECADRYYTKAVIDDDSPLLTPKEVFKSTKQPKSPAVTTSEGETPISQVRPLLGTTPSENNEIQHRNMPDNILDILGTRVYQGYVETLLQTLDGIIVNQSKQFLPLAEEAKRIAEEIRIEKINEQWAGIPREQLLNQSFTDQLNSIQILEQLAPLQLAKEHLPGDISDILERLGKADNIPFNQLYYIAENCADCYYSKVIETFISILKHQFANCQLLLVNTTQSLKFL